MKLVKLNIKTKTKKYPLIVGSNIIPRIYKITKNCTLTFDKCLLVVDKKVPRKFITKIKKSLKQKKIYICYFNVNERNKNFTIINKILKILLNKNFTREDCLVSIGGGITGDVGGFAASIFKRGLKFINIPTTLLSQVDSSIGGKTGINSIYGKNLIGSFYQPDLVISDIQFLKSLPKREIICGYGEILKHSLIRDKKFFNYLNKNSKKILNLSSPHIKKAIYESCKIKKSVIEKDENETSLRKILNFGHTFGHAYEASLGYSKKLNHGEAVILGMKTALNFSLKKNIIKFKDYDLIINHINNLKLKLSINKFFSLNDLNNILFFMTRDKKNRSEKINLLLLKKIGSPIMDKQYTKNSLRVFFNDYLRN